jgi:predicted nuclease of predicted toxin-antitoxin system
MRFLFDQNISQSILRLLPEDFDGSTHVNQEGLMNSPDIQIWEFAKKNDYCIVTQDSDFNSLNSLYGFSPKIIWIRTGNIKTQLIAEILIESYSEIEKFIEDKNYGCFEIIRLAKE